MKLVIPVSAVTHSKAVKFADLDLSKSEGLKALLSPIHSAAGEVCAPKPETKDVNRSAGYKKCVGDAVNGRREGRQSGPDRDGEVTGALTVRDPGPARREF